MEKTIYALVNTGPKAKRELFGSGKVQEINSSLREVRRVLQASGRRLQLVVVNVPIIHPAHRRTLEHEWDCTILDRYGLILEVFRVRTHAYPPHFLGHCSCTAAADCCRGVSNRSVSL